MLYMLDTDIASYIIKERPRQVLDRLRAVPATQVCISVMTRAELLFGLKGLPPTHQIRFAVQQFFGLVRTLPWNTEAAVHYADIRYQLTNQQRNIGEMDMMIAAHSIAEGAALVTNNTKHFKQISAPLMILNWAEPA